MGKLVVSLDGVVIKEVQITKDKTTLGRRPYNDIVIDNLAVSGEHAVLQMVGADVFIEDLNSTNGTYINGKAVKKQLLAHNDTVEIGKYKIKFVVEDGTDYEKTMIMKPGMRPPGPAPGTQAPHAPQYASAPASLYASQASGQPLQSAGQAPHASAHAPQAAGAAPQPSIFGNSNFIGLGGATGPASIKVLSGAAAGREVALTKVVTTVGKPGVQVASITKRPNGYVLAHVEGTFQPMVNGNPLVGETVPLRNGDVIELAGTQMQFVQA